MYDERRLLQFYVGLTPRQREVLQLVSEGLSNQEAADRLCIAATVVAGHLTNIYDEMANLIELDGIRPNRYLLIRTFSEFFRRFPELDNFQTTSRLPHCASGCPSRNRHHHN